TFNLSLSGSFDAPDAGITRDSARVNIVVRPDSRLQSGVAAAASFERRVSDVKAPIVTSCYDVATSSFDRYTPGSIIRLQGDHLKFDPTRADEGVFLRGETAEIRTMIYSVIGTKQIDALVPATAGGALQVIVRARYSPGGELREGRLPRSVGQV